MGTKTKINIKIKITVRVADKIWNVTQVASGPIKDCHIIDNNDIMSIVREKKNLIF